VLDAFRWEEKFRVSSVPCLELDRSYLTTYAQCRTGHRLVDHRCVLVSILTPFFWFRNVILTNSAFARLLDLFRGIVCLFSSRNLKSLMQRSLVFPRSGTLLCSPGCSLKKNAPARRRNLCNLNGSLSFVAHSYMHHKCSAARATPHSGSGSWLSQDLHKSLSLAVSRYGKSCS
jgi:hypothetical protein